MASSCPIMAGRQVDGAIAALDALPSVVDAAAGRIRVLFDSGVRTGSDIVKALCLGAGAVLIGRRSLAEFDRSAVVASRVGSEEAPSL